MEVWRLNVEMHIRYLTLCKQTQICLVCGGCQLWQDDSCYNIWLTNDNKAMQNICKAHRLTTYSYLTLCAHLFAVKSVTQFMCSLCSFCCSIKWSQTKAFKGQYLFWLSLSLFMIEYVETYEEHFKAAKCLSFQSPLEGDAYLFICLLVVCVCVSN